MPKSTVSRQKRQRDRVIDDCWNATIGKMTRQCIPQLMLDHIEVIHMFTTGADGRRFDFVLAFEKSPVFCSDLLPALGP